MTVSFPPSAIMVHAQTSSVEKAVLLYAGSCPRCRAMARMVAALSFGQVETIALDISEWRVFYDRDLPESRGYPVLFRKGVATWGPRVFAATLGVALSGGVAATVRRLRRTA